MTEYIQHVTVAQFAKIVGVSRRRIDQLVEAGTIEKRPDRTIDLDAALPRYFQSLRDAARKRGLKVAGSEVVSDPIAAQARLNREKALLWREKNRIRKADLTTRETVERAFGAVVKVARFRVADLKKSAVQILESAGHLKSERAAVATHLDRVLDELEQAGRLGIALVAGSALERDDLEEVQ